MAIIAPFQGLTYDFNRTGDISTLAAPPYDVISEQKQEDYYQADPNNVIRLILGKKKDGDSDWDNRYTRAADLFKRWESDGTLIRANQPCVYLTSLTYDPGNGEDERTRWGLIVLVQIEDENSGVILPHEKTFSAHKDDRLKLMKACSAQFSQIFGLYEDSDNIILDACRKSIDFPPQIAFDFEDDSRHQMWILEQSPLVEKIAHAMLDKPIFIADGHHRYETARNFRNISRARYGRRPADKSYEYVMMYLSNMSDEGLTILPSHRLIKNAPEFELSVFLERLEKWFDITKFPMPDTITSNECDILKKRLEEKGHNGAVFAFYQHESSQYYMFSLKPEAVEEMGDDLHSSLKKLDVIVLSRLVLRKGLDFNKKDLDNDKIFSYQSSMKKALSQVRAGNYQMTFLLNPTRIDHVKEVAGNSLIMPRKSTYFYPKVLTGLVFNKIEPHELIQIP